MSSFTYWAPEGSSYPLAGREDTIPAFVRNAFLEELGAGTELKQLVLSSASDAVSLAGEGKADIIFGFPIRTESAICPDGYRFTDCIFEDSLAAVIMKDSVMAPVEDAGNYYWGVDSALLTMLDGSGLESRAVDFTNEKEMLTALRAGSIYGAFVRRSSIDAMLKSGEFKEYRQYEGISIPFCEGVLFKNDPELGNAVMKAAEEVRSSGIYKEYDSLAVCTNELADARSELQGFRTAVFIIAPLLLLMTVLACIFRCKYRKSERDAQAKLKVLFQDNPDIELMELDLRRQTLKSHGDFGVFGLAGRGLPDTLSLKKLEEMLGYNFAEHYRGVGELSLNAYHGTLVFYRGGIRYSIKEEGRRAGDRWMLTMVRQE